MGGGEKACWKTILFQASGDVGGVGGEPSTPSRQDRLAMLYRFQNGHGSADVRLVDPSCRRELTDPAQIDWTHFPVVDALEAVTRDELHRLRSLLRADSATANGANGASVATTSSARPPTPPNGMIWGVDLRKPQAFAETPPTPQPPSSEA